jgi:alpha-N-arabinofuranosidase
MIHTNLMKPPSHIAFALATCLAIFQVDAQTASLTIETGSPAAKVSPMHYGLMTEEINFSYDGGLYAELVRNRAFLDDPQEPKQWSPVTGATIALDPANPLNEAIPTSLRVEASAAGGGVSNGGYWGIPVKPATRYRATFFAKGAAGFQGPVTIAIQSDDGTMVYAKAAVPSVTGDWRQYEVDLSTSGDVKPTTKARLALTVEKPGTIWLSLVSLFPPTWKDRPNGLRPDIMKMLVDMKPAFLRFPGGNYLEGDTIDTRFDWKKTLGPISGRSGHPCPWGYRSTDGMGLMEFLLWCEDMNAEPVLALYAGYSLKGDFVKPGKDLEPYVQDALEEIEYVTGSVETKWGARRARDGHPEPFKLRYVEIGNEDFFDKSGSYQGRFAQFYDAIKKTYPHLKCISSVGNEQPVRKRVRSRQPDVLDEHYYRSSDAFLEMARGHYDGYDRKGPEIFVGEWAAHETPFVPWDKRSRSEPPTPNMKAALGDAAFMTNMERNSDIVTMQCYAPLLVNVNENQWRPNLIGYDALTSFGSPSYHANKMFSTNVGDEILKARISEGAGLHHSVTRDHATGVIFIKLVNPKQEPQPLEIRLDGLPSANPRAQAVVLAAAPDATNSITAPASVVPAVVDIDGIKPVFTYTLAASSIVVIKVTAQ